MKFRNKIISLCAAIIVCLSFIGCDESSNPSFIDSDVNANTTGDGTYEWVSPDGVHYWVYQAFYRYGIAPRYDSTGNLVID